LIKEDSKHTISRFLGFVLEDCESPYEGAANVLLGDPTPTLCYPVGSRELRVLVDFPHERAHLISGDRDKLNDHLLNNVMPYFPPTMHESFKNAVSKGKFMSMPNQSMTAHPKPELSGIALIGDALNMRHPLTGGGMTVGLKDVEILSEILSDWQPVYSGKHVDYNLKDKLAHFYEVRRQPNAVINILADALYCVFSQKYQDLRSSCYSYLERGGFYLAGPISFLAGISESQSFLLYHFFAVAVFSLTQLLPNVYRSYGALRDAVHIIHPLVRRSATEMSLKVTVSLLRMIFH
jgi:squalene monooxygenase